MKFKSVFFIPLVLIIVSISCVSTAQVSENSEQTQAPLLSSPFVAEVTSPVSVQLTWKPVEGVQKYLVAVRLGESDFIPVAELPANQTSFEDLSVPESSELTYRLQALTSTSTSDVGTATVKTSEIIPNPLTVQPNEYEPIVWTPPTQDPNNPNLDPSNFLPPGFDPNHPEDFDPSSAMQQVQSSAEIGPEGGNLSIKTPDNITYDLTIPPGALDDSTLITLIPIETIDGLPFSGGLQGAVSIEPDGLMLDIPASLKISRADSMPIPEGMVALGFGFDGSGEEFHLMPFAPADQTGLNPGAVHMASLSTAPTYAGPLADIAAQQLKGYGIGNGTLKEAAAVVKKNNPTGAEEELLNELAYGEADPELIPLTSRPHVATAKLLSLAQSEAPDWSQITVSLAQLEILMKYYGKDPSLKGDLAKILDLLADRLSKMLNHNLEKCLTGDDAYAQAVVQKILGAKSGTMYDALKKKLDPQLVKDVAEMKKKCNLALTIQSTIHEDDNVSAANDVKVQGQINNLKFNFRNGKVYLTGRGTIAYSNVKITPKKSPKSWCEPWIPNNFDSVTPQVIVTRIDLEFANVPNGVLQSVKLRPMTVTDNAVFKGVTTCHDIDSNGKEHVTKMNVSVPTRGGSLWYGYFTVAHMSNKFIEFIVQPADSRPLNNSGQPIIATFNSNQPSFSPGYGTWSEDSMLELVDAKSK